MFRILLNGNTQNYLFYRIVECTLKKIQLSYIPSKVWEERQSKLNSILEQLDCRLATQILKELANLGNVYAKSFTVVIEDIKQVTFMLFSFSFKKLH